MDSPNNGHFETRFYCYRGCPFLEVKLYYHGSVGTTELVLYKEVNVLCPGALKSYNHALSTWINSLHS